MKVCSDCKEDKTVDQFNKHSRDKLQPWCRDCQKKRYKKHYAANREYYKLREIKQRVDAADLIRTLKDVPCKDCGVKYPSYVMQFDHLRDKFMPVSMMGKYGKKRILKEAEKCEIVCANCHAERTHVRRCSITV